MELRRPTLADEAAFHDARAAVPANNPTFLRGYRDGMRYDDYLRLLDRFRAGVDLPPDVAPSTLLFAFADDGAIVGRASLRHALVPPKGPINGHIGYAVLPAYRRQGYATRILQAAARIARRELGIARVMVSCDDDNFPSIGVIEKAGGVFADTIHDEAFGRPKRRYWIDADTLDAQR